MSKEGWNAPNSHGQKPPIGWFEVNIDGSHNPSSSSSSCGGLIRDEACAFLKGFFCKLSPCNSLWAELCALLHGIK